MGFGEAIRTCFRKYVRFSGRAPRSEYWFWFLFLVLVFFADFIVAARSVTLYEYGHRLGLFIAITALGLFLPSLAVAIRRLHDTNSSGWWVLLGFIPYVGAAIMVVLGFIPGTKDENRFGPNPLQPADVEAFD